MECNALRRLQADKYLLVSMTQTRPRISAVGVKLFPTEFTNNALKILTPVPKPLVVSWGEYSNRCATEALILCMFEYCLDTWKPKQRFRLWYYYVWKNLLFIGQMSKSVWNKVFYQAGFNFKNVINLGSNHLWETLIKQILVFSCLFLHTVSILFLHNLS